MQSVYPISEGAGVAVTTGRYYTPSGRLIQRPWDGSFDEYLTYTLRDQSAARQHKASDLKYTDAGRKVYSGGGIEPDKFVVGAGNEGFNPTRFGRLLAARQEFANFADQFRAEGDTRLSDANKNKKPISRGFTVTDAMLNDFKASVVKREAQDRRGELREGRHVHPRDDPFRDRCGAVQHGGSAPQPDREGPAGAVRAGAVRRGRAPRRAVGDAVDAAARLNSCAGYRAFGPIFCGRTLLLPLGMGLVRLTPVHRVQGPSRFGWGVGTAVRSLRHVIASRDSSRVRSEPSRFRVEYRLLALEAAFLLSGHGRT